MDPTLQMFQKVPPYLYDSNPIFEVVILLVLVLSLTRARYFVVALLGINLLRLNERFNMSLPFSVIAFLLLIPALFIHSRKANGAYTLEREDKVLIALVVFVLLLTVAFHLNDLSHNFMICGLGLLSYIGYTRLASDEQGLRLMNYGCIVFCLLICLEPLYYHFTESEGSEMWRYFHMVSRINAWGIWRNANETAFLACFGVGNGLMLYVRERKATSLLWVLSSFPVFLYTIFLSRSRAGAASLGIILIAIVLTVNSKIMRSVGIVALIAAVFFLPLALSKRADMEASSSERADLRYEGIQLFKQYPLRGDGFYRASEDAVNVLHNTYIQAFAETGIVGGSLFLYYMYCVGAKLTGGLWVCLRSRGRRRWLGDNVGLLLGFFLSAAFYLYFGNQFLSVMFFVSMALLKVSYSVVTLEAEDELDQDRQEG